MLNSTEIEDVVEVSVKLGKKFVREEICLSWQFNFLSCGATSINNAVYVCVSHFVRPN